MKFLVEKYRVISICLSLAILVLTFYIISDETCQAVCVPLAFLLGALMYLTGGIREKALDRIPTFMVEMLLGICAFAAAVVSFLRFGGWI